MSNKRYYWLKLKNDFFESREMKKLRRIAGGATYTIIYLKMQLLSINSGGVLVYEGTEENIAEQLALELDEEVDDVRLTLSFLSANKLMEQLSHSEYLLNRVSESVGSETAAAERMRKMRARNDEKRNSVTGSSNNVTALLQPVTTCYTEKEKEIDIDIDKDIELMSEQSSDGNKSSYKFNSNSIEFKIAVVMTKTILENKPNADIKHINKNLFRETGELEISTAKIQKWCRDIDRTMRIDGKTAEEIVALFKWAQDNSFWQSNILSAGKLREKWDTLEIQMKNRTGKKADNYNNTVDSWVDSMEG